jgi:site-specific recombinase XerD
MRYKKQQLIITDKEQVTNFRDLWDDFLKASRAAERADGTLRFYQFHANLIITWLERQGIYNLEEITPAVITQCSLRIQHGKGYKERTVFVCVNCKKYLCRWLRHRDGCTPEEAQYNTTANDGSHIGA